MITVRTARTGGRCVVAPTGGSDRPHVDLDLQLRPGADAAAAVVRLRGALDVASCDQLLRMGERLVAAGLRHVVLDCSGLDFCDLHGLRAALALADRVGPDGTVSLEHPPALLVRLLQATGRGDTFVLSPGRQPEPRPAQDRSPGRTPAA